MILTDLKKAKPGMYFFIDIAWDSDDNIIRRLKQEAKKDRISLNPLDLEIASKYYQAKIKDTFDPPEILIKVGKKFNASEFLNNLQDDITGIRCAVLHGSYVSTSCLMLMQHAYASSDSEDEQQGFMEVLEILDPPQGRKRALLVQFFVNDGYAYYEFNDLSQAMAGFNAILSQRKNFNELNHSALRRAFEKPWFYANLAEELQA